MILMKLILKNFKGHREFTFEPNGQNASIFGANGTGKTSIPDAITWLLYGKDTLDRANFEIKALDEAGSVIEELRMAEHSVEAVFDTITLKKVFSENWVRKHGDAISSFAGNKYSYSVRGVPMSEGEYKKEIGAIAPADVFKVVTNPFYYHTVLDWKSRRDTLIKSFANMTDTDVIDADSRLEGIRELLTHQDRDKSMAIISSRRSVIKSELEKIPIRIRESQESLPKEIISIDKSEAKLKKLIESKIPLQKELSDVQNGSEAISINARIMKCKADISSLESACRMKDNEANTVIRNTNQKNTEAYEQKVWKKKKLFKNIEDAQIEITHAGIELENIRKTYTIRKSNTWEQVMPAMNPNCPTCGQTVPADYYFETKQKQEAQFNESKANDLKSTRERGDKQTAAINELKEKISEWQNEIDEMSLNEAPESLQLVFTDVNTLPEYIKLNSTLTVLSDELTSSTVSDQPKIDELNQKISDVDTKTMAVMGDIKTVELTMELIKRITNHEEIMKKLIQEDSLLAQQSDLLEKFIISQCDMVESKINEQFKVVKWRLFTKQINGGISPCCEALYNGVPITTNASRSEGSKAGLDIIKTMSRVYNFSAPVFVDDRESISIIPDMGETQIISMYVSEKDTEIRWEV